MTRSTGKKRNGFDFLETVRTERSGELNIDLVKVLKQRETRIKLKQITELHRGGKFEAPKEEAIAGGR